MPRSCVGLTRTIRLGLHMKDTNLVLRTCSWSTRRGGRKNKRDTESRASSPWMPFSLLSLDPGRKTINDQMACI